jgi:hypothetical protein
MAAEITGANFMKIVGYPQNVVVASKAAQNDSILFPNDPMVLIQSAYTDNYGAETFVHASLTVASVASTDTTATYTGGSGVPRLQGSYFLKIDHEYVYVKSDTDETAAAGTLAIVRGALKTDIADHAGGSAYIQNALVLTGSHTGDVKIQFTGVPGFKDGLNFSTVDIQNVSAVNPNRIYGTEYELQVVT